MSDKALLTTKDLCSRLRSYSPENKFHVVIEAADAIDRLTAERDRAYSVLEAYGVPRDRARNVANGIEVLATRLNRASHEPLTAHSKSQQRRLEAQTGEPVQLVQPSSTHYALWKHLHDEHGLTLMDSELNEIVRLAPAKGDDHEST